ncbi:MAG: ATP-dependent DNA helicase RecG [Elusimicrobia bacterium]|nr:ATP-dependent DNA helicase RecG [Elusimicrobiota bacterium]
MSIENISVQYIKGVGEKTAQKLYRYLKIKSVKDLLYYFPREWEDRAHPKKISQLKGGERATVRGKVENVSTEWRGRYLVAFKAKIKDSSGSLNLIWLRRYTRSYDVLGTLKKEIKEGYDIFVTGSVSSDLWEKTVNVQEYEVITGDEKNLINANRIVPVYPLTKSFTNKFLRTIIKRSIEKYIGNFSEIIPEKYLKKYGLVDIKYAVQNIHFPETFTDGDNAKNRLAFDEFLDFQLKLEFLKQKHKYEKKEFKYILTKKLLTPFKANLPFELTAAQKNVINDIFDDMQSQKPMNRLLQGDVGSGKTVVALSTMLLAVESGFQAAILAPTEILAEQHFYTIKKLLKKLDVEVGFIIGQMSQKEKKTIKQKIADGTANIIIGTHALLEEDLKFKNLSLVVIDEQHRFGVEQRLKMRKKSKFRNADFLLMSATPIPRTLGLTLYGDLDISTIKELPPGRIPIKTLEMSDKNAYNFVREKIAQGEQAFIVYPLVDESEKLQLKSAIKEAENLRVTEFTDFSVGLIYGRMKPEEKELVMSDFAKKKYQILISTTVIESGIDITNATVMVIEHAERYGLSTLHQLRGRVGRGDKESYCILIGDAKTENAKTRLDVLTKTNDGFKIAEEDLKLRGYGEFFGTQQSGLTEFKIGNMISDFEIIQKAKETAVDMLKNESQSATFLLSKSQNEFLKKDMEFAEG